MVIAFIGFTVANLLLQRRINIANDYVNDATKRGQLRQGPAGPEHPDLGAEPAIRGQLGQDDQIIPVTASPSRPELRRPTGSMEVTASASNAYQGAVYLNNLINSGLFSSVEYQGYTYSGSTGTTNQNHGEHHWPPPRRPRPADSQAIPPS